MKLSIGLGAATVVIAGAAAVAFVWLGPSNHPRAQKPSIEAVRPTLYCEFYNLMRNATVVSFNFAVSHGTEQKLDFTQLYVVEPDGTKTEYPSDPPRWRNDRDDDGTRVIASPDGATRIVLYGLRNGVGGVFWTEAGIRSNTYRNLEGKCRQAHLDKTTEAAAPVP